MKDTFKIGDLVYVQDPDNPAKKHLGTLLEVIPIRECDNQLAFVWHALVGTDIEYVDERYIFKLPRKNEQKEKK
mgnify:CR=1 FL=1